MLHWLNVQSNVAEPFESLSISFSFPLTIWCVGAILNDMDFDMHLIISFEWN